jgi:CRISPR-associated endonuclease/helicase Cas3
MEYLAHYDKEKGIKDLLNDHLPSMAEIIKKRVTSEINFNLVDCNKLVNNLYWVAYLHDLGKYTDFFQKYIRLVPDEKENYKDKLKNHAHISAWIYNFYSKKILSEDERDVFLRMLSYLSIRFHHGRLDTNIVYNNRIRLGELKNLIKRKNNIEKKIEDIQSDINLSLEDILKFDETTIKNEIKLFSSKLHKLKFNFIKDEQYYFLLLYIFSLLIDIDKINSAKININKLKTITPIYVTEYLNKINADSNSKKINRKRESARLSIINKINQLKDEEIDKKRFFILTAPTGLGKTLASLQAAIMLQDKIEKIKNYKPRLITAIPFINIIEQTYKDYKNVSKGDLKIIKHHRLSDFSKIKSKNEEIAIDKELLEMESWECDVVITTFVQLFHSIFNSKNKPLKKINKLAGSIIILDEIQSIPEKYLSLIGATLYALGKYFGTRFIIMTATQPKIIKFAELLLDGRKFDEFTVDLLEDNEKYYRDLKRTRFVPIFADENKHMDTSSFINLFMEKWSPDKSALIVVNTIRRSIEIYDELKKKLMSDSASIFYLSTNIIPLKRAKVIDEVRIKLNNKEPVILVSTQTIEAGVNLDFDIGFRDLAPLPSLVQTAGRVNREGKKENYSPVYIVNLEKDSSYIYKLYQLEDTKKFLESKGEIKENEYKEIMDEYYANSLERGLNDASKDIWENGVLKLDFDKIEEFALIEKIGNVYDVYIEDGSAKATNLADLYENLLTCGDNLEYDLKKVFDEEDDKEIINKYNGKKLSFHEKKALLRLVLAKMNNYVIQVRLSDEKSNFPLPFESRNGVNSNLYWVPPNQLNEYYNFETGFISKTGSSLVY